MKLQERIFHFEMTCYTIYPLSILFNHLTFVSQFTIDLLRIVRHSCIPCKSVYGGDFRYDVLTGLSFNMQ